MEQESSTSWKETIRRKIKALKKQAGKALVVEKTTADIKEKRINACNSCDMLSVDRECMMCGCFIDVKAGSDTHINPKTMKVEITYCPKYRWDEEMDRYLHNYYKSQQND